MLCARRGVQQIAGARLLLSALLCMHRWVLGSDLHACPCTKKTLRFHPPAQVLLAKLEALTGTEAAAQSMQQYQEMYR